MTTTRDELKLAAEDLHWGVLPGIGCHADVYRNAPYSIMVEFSRDGMVIEARLFSDPPDVRQKLAPRVLAEVAKNNRNKRRRIRSWLYDYQTRAS